MGSGPAEDPVDLDLDRHAFGVLASRSVSPLESGDGLGDLSGLRDHAGVPFEGEPTASVHLADDRSSIAFDVANLLASPGGDDPDEPFFVREGDGDHVWRAVGSDRRERSEMTFGEETQLVLVELVGLAGHETTLTLEEGNHDGP